MSASPHLPPLRESYKISPEQVQEIIDDLSLARAGAAIYYVIDPFEIVDFCFPVDPTSYVRIDPAVVADNQVALHDVFFGPTAMPLLLPEYQAELEGYQAFLGQELSHVYRKVDLLQSLIEGVGISKMQATVDNNELLRYVEHNFNLLLAVNLGIYSLGADRFFQVKKGLITWEMLLRSESQLKRLVAGYRASGLVDNIYQAILRGTDPQDSLPGAHFRFQRAAKRDARAIDRLLYLNSVSESEFVRSHGKAKRYLFLYLSSAFRSRRAFDDSRVLSNLPMIDDRRYSLLRTKAQIFTQLAHRSSEADVEQTIRNLETFKLLLTEIRDIQSRFIAGGTECAKCILEGGSVADCKWLALCQRVGTLDNSVRARRNQMQNLSLLAAIRRYSNVAEQRKEMSKVFSGFHADFRLLYQRTELRELAWKRKDAITQLLTWKAEFSKSLPGLLTQAHNPDILRDIGVVTGAAQRLPTKPIVQSQLYSEIVSLITQAYGVLDHDRNTLASLLQDASTQFLDIDTRIEDPVADHELVRGLLYLGFRTAESTTLALRQMQECMAFELFARQMQEFRYVGGWAALRLELYNECEATIQRQFKEKEGDPRFHHLRALNAFCWATTESPGKDASPLSLADAIDEARKAIDLYEKEEGRADVIAANYNNIAYFRLCKPEDPSFDLNDARNALTTLQHFISKDDWFPTYPEYFHTDALCAFREYLFEKNRKAPASELRLLLEDAKKSVEKALEINPKKTYKDLHETIIKEFAENVEYLR